MSIFLYDPQIAGDVSDRSGHSGWIALTEVDWDGVTRRITSHSSTRRDRESSNPELATMTVVRELDRATPQLFMLACCGLGRDVTLHFTKTSHSGFGSDTFLELTLQRALVSRYHVAARRQPARRPKEKLDIAFSGIVMRYTPFSETNTSEAARTVGFDATTNERI